MLLLDDCPQTVQDYAPVSSSLSYKQQTNTSNTTANGNGLLPSTLAAMADEYCHHGCDSVNAWLDEYFFSREQTMGGAAAAAAGQKKPPHLHHILCAGPDGAFGATVVTAPEAPNVPPVVVHNITPFGANAQGVFEPLLLYDE